GDDVEVTAPGAVLAGSGSLTSTGVGATDDAHVLVRSSTGAVSLGSAATQGTGAALGDITIDAKTKATINGTVTSARDVQVLAETGVDAKSSSIGADRDVAATTNAGALELGA